MPVLFFLILTLAEVSTKSTGDISGTQKQFIQRVCEEVCLSTGQCKLVQNGKQEPSCHPTNTSGISKPAWITLHAPGNKSIQSEITMIPKSKEFVINKVLGLCQRLWSTPRQSDGYVRVRAGRETLIVKRHEEKLTWDGAQTVCLSEGGALVKVDTKEKHSAIQRRISRPRDLVSSFYMWIALIDLKKDNTFKWVDGSPLVYTHWGPESPSHSKKEWSQSSMDCVGLVKHVFYGFFWCDMFCHSKNGFICERLSV